MLLSIIQGFSSLACENFKKLSFIAVSTINREFDFFLSADGRYGERNGPESPKGQVTTAQVVSPIPLRGQLQQTRDLDNRQSRTASTATKELDDLMASLSDFKVNVTAAPTPSQARLSGDYAKPNKSKPASTPG